MQYHGTKLHSKATMPLLALPVLWTVHAAAASAFVGPVGPRAGAATGTSPDREPPTAGNGFSREDVRSLLRHRHALVIAGEDVTTALQVGESLADVGASVVVGWLPPLLSTIHATAVPEPNST